MTNALAVVEQTPLAKLIDQREDLSESLRNLRKALKSAISPNVDGVMQQRHDAIRNAQSNLEVQREELQEWKAASDQRAALLSADLMDAVASLLRRDDFSYQIRNAERSMEYWQERLDAATEALDAPIVDRRAELSNHLAEVETRLKDVRDKIKEMMG